jgi:FkbM family methyltransferase
MQSIRIVDQLNLVGRAKRLARAVCPRPVLAWREVRYLMKHGEFELRLVKHLCQVDEDAIDVGAHEGVYIHFMRRHARRVYAFEPIPWLAEGIARRFRRGVIVEALALSRSRGTAHLRIPVIENKAITGLSSLTDGALTRYTELRELRVPTAPLDEIYSGCLGFMKIDVEGHEEAVLEGAQETLLRCRPRILVEVEERHSPGGVARVADFFARLDYRGFFVFDGALMQIERFDATAMQHVDDAPAATAILADGRSGRYVNNFLFLPQSTRAALLVAITGELARRRMKPA